MGTNRNISAKPISKNAGESIIILWLTAKIKKKKKKKKKKKNHKAFYFLFRFKAKFTKQNQM
jgi:hypothetical protein